MGFFGGKFSGFRLGLKKNSGHPECPPTASSSRPHHHHQRHRKRRFHVSPQALGVDFHNYNLAAPSQPTQWPATPGTPSQPSQWSATPWPPPQPATEPRATDLDPEPLSDQEVAQQPARRGMRICAWTLWIVLLCFNYKWIVEIWGMAARAWPNLQ
jgi:hypothetical protein